MYLDTRALDAADINDKVLRESYEFCRRLLITMEGRSFWAATLTLPMHKRPHICAVYGLARYADQLVDSGNPSTRITEFETWAGRLVDDLRHHRAGDPIARALGHTMKVWNIALTDIEKFLDGMRMDLTITGYATYHDLQRYLTAVDGSLANMTLPLLEPHHPDAKQYVVATSTAMQLTNFIRDISKDYRRLGRCYLPQEDLDQFGVTRNELGADITSPALRQLVRFEIQRARKLWDYGSQGIPLLDPTSQLPSRLAAALYREILDEIERREYEVLDSRATVSTRRKAAIILKESLTTNRYHQAA